MRFTVLIFTLLVLVSLNSCSEGRDEVAITEQQKLALPSKELIQTNKRNTLYSDLMNAIQLELVQPPDELVRRIEHRPSESDSGVKRLSDYSREELPYKGADILIENYIPYYPQHALKDGSNYVLHPMAMGRFLLSNAHGLLAEKIVSSIKEIAYKLPNGGLAWYYPRHYRVNRMLGNALKYSSISQGTIIAGLVGMARENKNMDLFLARQTFLAMMWPFEKGGINLANRAVLEMPSFSGPPEIILNGWIDALLHISDYASVSGDKQAWSFFKKNIEFMVEILPNFDAPTANISRYSDLSPYRVKVTLARPKDIDSLKVLYRPKHDALDPILVPLKRTKDPANFSNYENQIFTQNGKEAFVWLSCSQLYDTVLLADSDSLHIELNTGQINRKLSSPGSGGDILQFDGLSFDEDTQYITISRDDGLICGYPTNFAKGGKENYYHVYHVVGLMLLALDEGINGYQHKQTLIQWALKWYEDVDEIKNTEGLQFRDFQDVLSRTNENQAIVTHTNFQELLSKAKAALNMK